MFLLLLRVLPGQLSHVFAQVRDLPGREAEWLALVALHSGAFTRAQCGVYFQAGDDRKRLLRFVRALIEKQLAIEDARPIFPGGARAVLLTGKPIYRALGIPDVRHRRSKAATTSVLMRRLLSLDYLIERPTFGWLPTVADKVQRFEALGLDQEGAEECVTHRAARCV